MKSRCATLLTIVSLIAMVWAATLVNRTSREPAASAAETAVGNQTTKNGAFSRYVDKSGNISLPKNYKQNWAHLGGWAAAKKKGAEVHEMHNVYTPRETIAAYNKTGKFPDGAVLVKEVRKSKSDRLTTGHAAWSTDMKLWFVMIKDQEGRFKDNDHWGEGWGWALFEAKDPTKNVSVDHETSCVSCHIPAEDTDWVYVYGYPDLKKRKK